VEEALEAVHLTLVAELNDSYLNVFDLAVGVLDCVALSSLLKNCDESRESSILIEAVMLRRPITTRRAIQITGVTVIIP
jgi:hypothetical protein